MEFVETVRDWYSSLSVWQQTIVLFVLVVGIVTVIYTGLIMSIHHPEGPGHSFETQSVETMFFSYESPAVDTTQDFVIRSTESDSVSVIKYNASAGVLLRKTGGESSRAVSYVEFNSEDSSIDAYSRMDLYEARDEPYPVDTVVEDALVSEAGDSCSINDGKTVLEFDSQSYANSSAFQQAVNDTVTYESSLAFGEKFLYTPLTGSGGGEYSVGEHYFWTEKSGNSDVQVLHMDGSGTAELTEDGRLSELNVTVSETLYDAYYVGPLPIVADTAPVTEQSSINWSVSYTSVTIEEPVWTGDAVNCASGG